MSKKQKTNIVKRSLENPSVPLTAAYDYLALSSRQAGVSVNRVSIHQIPALRRAVQIVSDRIAKCGVDVYRQTAYGPEIDIDHPAHWLLWRKPALGFTPFEFIKTVVVERCIYGNSFWAIKRDTKYNPLTFIHLDPEYTGLTVYDDQIWYITQINGVETKIVADDVLHFKNLADATGLMGMSPLMYCQQILGLSLAILKYETFQFQNQCKPSVILTLPPALANDPVKRQNFRKTFEQMQTGIENAGRVAIFESGINTTVIDQNNQSTQLVELNEKQERAICQLIGIDPSAVGLDVSTSHNSLEQKEETLLENLDGPMTAIEQELEEKLLKFSQQRNDTHVILFNRKDFIRTDAKTQNDIDLAELQSGGLSWEEYRIKKNRSTERTSDQIWFHMANVVPFDVTNPMVDTTTNESPTEDLTDGQVNPENEAETKAESEPESKQEDSQTDTESRAIAQRLLHKTAKRIVNRLQKAVESRSAKDSLESIANDLEADHKAIIIDSIDCLQNHEQLTNRIIDELSLELRSITKEDLPKINWERFKEVITNGSK